MITTISPWAMGATAAMGLIGSAGIGGMFKAWLDHKRGERKQSDDVALNLIPQLQFRIATLEKGAERERILCDAKLAVERHRVSNVVGNFDALLMLIELAPDKTQEMVAKIRERRANQETSEAIEKTALSAIEAQIAALIPMPEREAA